MTKLVDFSKEELFNIAKQMFNEAAHTDIVAEVAPNNSKWSYGAELYGGKPATRARVYVNPVFKKNGAIDIYVGNLTPIFATAWKSKKISSLFDDWNCVKTEGHRRFNTLEEFLDWCLILDGIMTKAETKRKATPKTEVEVA